MNRERRTVLRGVAAATGIVVGGGTGVAAESGTGGTAESRTGFVTGARTGVEQRAERRGVRQQVDAELQPGVTLFDLDDDGEYAVTVERAGEAMRDDDHPRPIHVTSGGRSTVDYAVSAVEPPSGTTLGGLDSLSYDYYVGGGAETGGSTTGAAPGETFLVVENDDGRHGVSLAVDQADDGGDGGESGNSGGGGDSAQWQTFDVLSRMGGEGGDGATEDEAGDDGETGSDGTGGGGTGGRWFEYTAVEDGYDGESFDDPVERFGADARLVRVGVGVGDAVTPVAVDAYYGNLVVDGETQQFPASVVNRVT